MQRSTRVAAVRRGQRMLSCRQGGQGQAGAAIGKIAAAQSGGSIFEGHRPSGRGRRHVSGQNDVLAVGGWVERGHKLNGGFVQLTGSDGHGGGLA